LKKEGETMRKILRNIARANMRKAGIKRMNKEKWAINPNTGLPVKCPSYFALNWRDYV